MLVVESLFGYCKCLFLNIPNGVCFHGWAGRTPVQVGLMIDSILHDPKQSGIFFNRWFFRGKKSLRHILYKYKRGTSKEHQVSQCAGLLTSVINKQHRGWLLVTRYPVKVADDCGMMLFCIFTQTIRYWTYLCLYILSSMHLNNTSGQFIINP